MAWSAPAGDRSAGRRFTATAAAPGVAAAADATAPDLTPTVDCFRARVRLALRGGRWRGRRRFLVLLQGARVVGATVAVTKHHGRPAHEPIAAPAGRPLVQPARPGGNAHAGQRRLERLGAPRLQKHVEERHAEARGAHLPGAGATEATDLSGVQTVRAEAGIPRAPSRGWAFHSFFGRSI